MLATRARAAAAGVSAAGNWWEAGGATGAVAVYQPIGAASLAASYLDLSGNGNDAAPGVAPSWASGTGWTFNGTTQYLTTGVTPGGDDDWSMIIRFSDANTGGTAAALAGAGLGNRNFHLFFKTSLDTRQYAQPTRFTRTGTSVSSGVMAVAGLSGYYNGSFDATLATVISDATPAQIYIGGSNSSVGLNAPADAKIQAVAIYNTTLTADQVAAISTAMAAL